MFVYSKNSSQKNLILIIHDSPSNKKQTTLCGLFIWIAHIRKEPWLKLGNDIIGIAIAIIVSTYNN